MGNCSGLFSTCTGEEHVRKVDSSAVQEALRCNQKEREDGNATSYGIEGVNMTGKLATIEGHHNFGDGKFDSHMTADMRNNNVRELRPPANLDSGAVYEGEWLNGVRDGQGR